MCSKVKKFNSIVSVFIWSRLLLVHELNVHDIQIGISGAEWDASIVIKWDINILAGQSSRHLLGSHVHAPVFDRGHCQHTTSRHLITQTK